MSLTNSEDHQAEIVKSIKPLGKFALIDDPLSLDVLALKQKSISFHWEFIFTRSLFETEDMRAQNQLLCELAGLIDSGLIKTTLSHYFGKINAENLRNAHAMVEPKAPKGKIVLEGFE